MTHPRATSSPACRATSTGGCLPRSPGLFHSPEDTVNVGDTIYLTKFATTKGVIVKVTVGEIGKWGVIRTSGSSWAERNVYPDQWCLTESEARAKADDAIEKRIASLEKSLERVRSLKGNVRLIDKTRRSS